MFNCAVEIMFTVVVFLYFGSIPSGHAMALSGLNTVQLEGLQAKSVASLSLFLFFCVDVDDDEDGDELGSVELSPLRPVPT